jgi:hypothetical protein
MGEEVNRVFYRYIRPVKFNTKTFEFDTLANGGICLRFERNDDGTTLFTYSRCHAEDHFNKGVAKTIADRRAAAAKSDARLHFTMSPNMHGIGESSEELAHFVMVYCSAFDPSSHPFLIGHYLSIEWKGFVDALRRIIKHNEREAQIGHMWMSAAGAMEATQQYAKINLTSIEP